MKRGILIFAAVIATAVCAFCLTSYVRRDAAPVDQMTWLRQEFALTPDQTAKIENLHAAYQPVCAAHCQRIAELADQLDTLAKSGKTGSPDYAATKTRWDAACAECAHATQKHLQAVAAAMSPEQGRRYLDMIGPKVAQQDHKQPLGLK